MHGRERDSVCSGGAGWWLGLGDNSKKLAWMNGMWESYGYLKAETEGSEDMHWESGWSGRTCDNRGFSISEQIYLWNNRASLDSREWMVMVG